MSDMVLCAKEDGSDDDRPTLGHWQKPNRSLVSSQKADAGINIGAQRSNARRLGDPLDRYTKVTNSASSTLQGLVGMVTEIAVSGEEMIEDQFKIALRFDGIFKTPHEELSAYARSYRRPRLPLPLQT